MEDFAEIANGFQPLTAIAKRSILDVWQGYECKSDTGSSHFIPELSLDTWIYCPGEIPNSWVIYVVEKKIISLM